MKHELPSVICSDGAKAKAAADKSFSRGWSRGDGQVNLRGSTNSANSDSNFDRAKNKSDGNTFMYCLQYSKES